MEVILSLEEIVAPLGKLSPYEYRLVENAYDFARVAHEGQTRRSGEAYFVHCAAVAHILADILRMDPPTIAAGLLHDVIEETQFESEDIEAAFGSEVARLVDSVTKMKHLPLAPDDQVGTLHDRDAEYLQKMFLRMDEDIRVILIKFADRLHNMRTLSHLSADSRERNAAETLEIYAPLAGMLGIWRMKGELEDLSFRHLYPEQYKAIAEHIAGQDDSREREVEGIASQLEALLAEHTIEANVSGRPKHIYSVWQKMERKGLPFEQIYDVRAVRVIVPDRLTCYQVLGIIHDTWRPIAGEFDDYIAVPKDNFYQSLHTSVVYERGKTLEVQIRTPEMHENAEYGVAAHWRYKEGRTREDPDFERRILYLRDLLAIGNDYDDAVDFLAVMKSEVFLDRVYAFTPKGDIIDLPMGATPIDFAYHVHTDIGHRCRGAKVNGKLVGLDYTLKTSDRVEILTVRRGGPSRDWLNPHLGYVKTKRAIAKIRQWFRHQDREKMITLGRDVLDRELKRLGAEHLSNAQIAEAFGYDKVEDFLVRVGFGDIHTQHIATRALAIERAQRKPEEDLEVPAPRLPTEPILATGIRIQGTAGLLTRLARCCNPVQGDEIVGYITRGRGVTVHRKDCSNILSTREGERLIAVEWGLSDDGERYPVPVIIRAYDRSGLLRDIGGTLADEHVNVLGITVDTEDHIATFDMTMEVSSADQLSRVLSKVSRLPNVIEVKRLSSH
jgi:RelA/SpoT family (p)ppGpp synthetase